MANGTFVEEGPELNANALVIATLSLAAFVFCLYGDSPPQPGAALVLLALAALAFEATAVPLRGFGSYSAAPACYLGLALLPEAGPATAALVLAAGGLVGLFRGTASAWTGKLLEVLAWVFPVVAAVAVVKATLGLELASIPRLAPSLAGAAAFGFGAMTVPSVLLGALGDEQGKTWGRLRESLLPFLFGAAAAGPLLAAAPGLAVLLVPLLWASHRAAAALRELDQARQQQMQQAELERKLNQQLQRLTATAEAQQRSSRELEVQAEAFLLFERLVKSLTDNPATGEVVQGLIQLVRQRVPCSSVVLFLKENGRLGPIASITPHARRLESAALAELQEPVVERAARSGMPEVARASDVDGPRIFEGEPTAVALPMKRKGILYVGYDQAQPFSDEQVRMLSVLATHGLLAIESAKNYEAQQTALQAHAAVRKHLEELVNRLALVIDTVRELVLVKDPGELVQSLGGRLEPIVPHTLRAIKAGEHHVLEGGEPIDRPALDELARAVLQNQLPLLIEDLSTSRFRPPAAGIASVVAVPLRGEEGPLGIILLGERRVGAYRREDQEILSVLAYQMGAAFTNVRLFHELQIAHQKLKESQAQLIQSSKMAAIGQLAAGVAHELNTPLGAVTLALDAAVTVLETRPDRAGKKLARAQQAASQMKEIVSKLLFYSRDARTGRQETDLNQVVGDTLKLLGNQFSLDNVDLRVEQRPVPVILANQNELQQVLTNLLLNARDAVLARGSSGSVIIRTGQSNGEVLLEVQDTGTGITPEVRERIFEPFFTTKDVGQGTGLGLSVTMELVVQHEGTIEVQSELGRGTLFTVRLPVLQEE
ncbi:MAG: GAF domain-containing protein [Armatimonadetes bacterium]|nr:GAF domain-containing protein [Armatimonadota bacterium]